LPERRFDVVWTASTFHHLTELEHICEQVERALVPGGVFAIYDYVGERRVQFSTERLERCRQTLATIPEEYFRNARTIAGPVLESISPFEAARSDDIQSVIRSRFDTLHWGETGPLLAVAFYAVDLQRLANERPDLLDEMIAADRAETLPGCVAYGVFRRRLVSGA
jgi:SAM-dependent methyltransferase